MILRMLNGTDVFQRLWLVDSSGSRNPQCVQLSRKFLFCLTATFVDGVATLIHLGRGAREVNPIWVWFIDQIGAIPTMGFRVVIGVVLLSLLFAAWQRPLAGKGITIMVAVFTPLTLYHLFLLVYLPMAS